MRSLIVMEILSLDGVMEDPAWRGDGRSSYDLTKCYDECLKFAPRSAD